MDSDESAAWSKILLSVTVESAIPFERFEPQGIHVNLNDVDEDEKDGLGVSTVKLPRWKEEWFEHFEEQLQCKIHKSLTYNENEHAMERLACVAYHFASAYALYPSRKHTEGQKSLAACWRWFKYFLGLLNFSIEYKKHGDVEEDSGEDDNDDSKASAKQYWKRVMKDVTGKTIRSQIFLNDPCEATRIFLSSFIHDKGLYDSLGTLRALPRLVELFFKYTIGVRALVEVEERLNDALEVCYKARAELPLMWKVGWDMPDKLSRCLKETFGPRELPMPHDQQGCIFTEEEGTYGSHAEYLEWMSEPDFLMTLLGPTKLPLAHKTGHVELSTRRIVHVHLPCETSGKVNDLSSHFATVDLEPWIPPPPNPYRCRDTRLDLIQMPRILRDPFRDCQVIDKRSCTVHDHHDPKADHIVMYVDVELGKHLQHGIGLGLQGEFVQLVPKKVSNKGVEEAFCYIDSPPRVIPSFWLEQQGY